MRWALRIIGVVLLGGAAICFLYARHEYDHALGAERTAKEAPNNPRWVKVHLEGAAASREDAQIGLFAGIGAAVVGVGLIVTSFLIGRTGKAQSSG